MAETPITFRLPSGALVTCTPAVAAAAMGLQNRPTPTPQPTTGDISPVDFAKLFREGLHNG